MSKPNNKDNKNTNQAIPVRLPEYYENNNTDIPYAIPVDTAAEERYVREMEQKLAALEAQRKADAEKYNKQNDLKIEQDRKIAEKILQEQQKRLKNEYDSLMLTAHAAYFCGSYDMALSLYKNASNKAKTLTSSIYSGSLSYAELAIVDCYLQKGELVDAFKVVNNISAYTDSNWYQIKQKKQKCIDLIAAKSRELVKNVANCDINNNQEMVVARQNLTEAKKLLDTIGRKPDGAFNIVDNKVSWWELANKTNTDCTQLLATKFPLPDYRDVVAKMRAVQACYAKHSQFLDKTSRNNQAALLAFMPKFVAELDEQLHGATRLTKTILERAMQHIKLKRPKAVLFEKDLKKLTTVLELKSAEEWHKLDKLSKHDSDKLVEDVANVIANDIEDLGFFGRWWNWSYATVCLHDADKVATDIINKIADIEVSEPVLFAAPRSRL